MAEEHAEIKRALAWTTDREEEHALTKIGQIRTADEGHIGIEVPILNMTLVESHPELATVRNGAKDMVMKNKHLKKTEKYAQNQLVELQNQISDLE